MKRDNSILTKQLKDSGDRITSISKEYDERIEGFKLRLKEMNLDINQQKSLVNQQRQTERDRLDKIAEVSFAHLSVLLQVYLHSNFSFQLQAALADYENENTMAMKKHQQKSEELESVKGKLASQNETQFLTEKKLNDLKDELTQAKNLCRSQNINKSDLRQQLEMEKRAHAKTHEELNKLKLETAKLVEIIDKQKFDLDEARSGLRINSPAIVSVRTINFI